MEEVDRIFNSSRKVRLSSLIILHIMIYSFCLFYVVYKEPSIPEYLLIILSVLVNSLSYTNVSLTDPGFISKKNRNVNIENTTILSDGSEIQTIFDKDTWIRFISHEGERYIQRYCEECNIFKIVGVAHCRECNYCVIEMDHHCFWFDTCIGRNNIRYFYYYIFSSFITVYYFSLSTYEIYRLTKRYDNFFCRSVATLSFAISNATYIFLFINLLFIVYYSYLLVTNIRSRDFIKGNERHCNIKFIPCLLRMITDKKVITCEELRV